LSDLERLTIIEDGMTLNPETCFELGLCKINQSIKILGHGEISKKLNVEDIPTSGSAAEKIKAAGGTVA
jgi:large subunit ribosomal protein L15